MTRSLIALFAALVALTSGPSVRAGAIPGTHVVTYDAPSESVTLAHVARNREGFAAGALTAAEWLPGHPGVHTFEDMLFGAAE